MGQHWDQEPPLSPALKRYLAAFDRHLRAKSTIDRAVSRADMTDALNSAGIVPRDRPVRNRQGEGKKPRRCVDCGVPISFMAERCASHAQRRWRAA
jgi:hypothetical protein